MCSAAYPWRNMSDSLSLSSSEELQQFLEDITSASTYVAENHYFDSLGSLIDLHTRFQSEPSGSLNDALIKIPVEEKLDDKELTCTGLARKLINVLLVKHPAWEPFIGLTITNEWIREEPVPASFWTCTSPPAFPEQCREHSLTFMKISLEDGRRAIAFIDPGRCGPLIVTEDGLPPQSPVLKYDRGVRTKEHVATWTGGAYAKWVIRNIGEARTTEMQLRIYVEGRFLAGDYLEWKNLIFPYRAIILMNPKNEIRFVMRTYVGGEDKDNAIFFTLRDQDGKPRDLTIPFNSSEVNWDESQKFAVNVLKEKVCFSTVMEYLSKLCVVLNDKAFVEQLMALWEENRSETARTLF